MPATRPIPPALQPHKTHRESASPCLRAGSWLSHGHGFEKKPPSERPPHFPTRPPARAACDSSSSLPAAGAGAAPGPEARGTAPTGGCSRHRPPWHSRLSPAVAGALTHPANPTGHRGMRRGSLLQPTACLQARGRSHLRNPAGRSPTCAARPRVCHHFEQDPQTPRCGAATVGFPSPEGWKQPRAKSGDLTLRSEVFGCERSPHSWGQPHLAAEQQGLLLPPPRSRGAP